MLLRNLNFSAFACEELLNFELKSQLCCLVFQIIPPHDKGIQESIQRNLEPWPNAWKTDTVVKDTSDPLEDIMTAYYAELNPGSIYKELNATSKLKFTYTPMHGVGQEYMKKGFENANFKVTSCQYFKMMFGYEIYLIYNVVYKWFELDFLFLVAIHFGPIANGSGSRISDCQISES